MVCTHNHHLDAQTTPLGEPILDEETDLIALFSEDEEEHFAHMERSPLARAKRRGLLRNAAIVLGNQKHIQALPALRKTLKLEDDHIILDACKWAIDEIRTALNVTDENEIT
jgi:epoxyqueuosine reductase